MKLQIANKSSAVNNDPIDMFKISDLVFGRYIKLGFEKLGPEEKVFQCVWRLEAEVNNGGFDQFYFNSAGDQATDTVKSLELIGANHTANLVRRANTLFGEAGPSPDRYARQEQLFAFCDKDKAKELEEITEAFLEYKDPLGKMLEAYVWKNVESFQSK